MLIQVIDVIMLDDVDAAMRAKLSCFHGWANAAMIGMTHHPCSSSDEPPLKNKRNLVE